MSCRKSIVCWCSVQYFMCLSWFRWPHCCGLAEIWWLFAGVWATGLSAGQLLKGPQGLSGNVLACLQVEFSALVTWSGSFCLNVNNNQVMKQKRFINLKVRKPISLLSACPLSFALPGWYPGCGCSEALEFLSSTS